MMIINGIKKFSMYCTYLGNYGSMLLLQQMYTLYNLIPRHNSLSQNTFYQNTFSKTPSGQNILVHTYSVQCTLYSIHHIIVYSVYHAYCILYSVYCIVGVAKIFRFTCTLFWSIPTYSRTLSRSFSEK